MCAQKQPFKTIHERPGHDLDGWKHFTLSCIFVVLPIAKTDPLNTIDGSPCRSKRRIREESSDTVTAMMLTANIRPLPRHWHDHAIEVSNSALTLFRRFPGAEV